MRKRLVCLFSIALFLSAWSAGSQDPQLGAAGASALAGRWQIQLVGGMGRQFPIAIIEIGAGASGLSGKVLTSPLPNPPGMRVEEISVKERSKRIDSAFSFLEKVDRIEPAKLLIVAFVQDDQTKEILQASLVKPGF